MKTTDEIIGILKQFKPIAVRKYGLTRIDLFGSVAWGEQHDGSDVDVCYEGRIPTLLILDQMQTELEQLFGCPVDMVRIRKQMNPLLNSRIKKEAIYV